MSKYDEIERVVNRMISNGVIPMSEYDFDVCHFVSDYIDNVLLTVYDENDININILYRDSLNSFTIFDDMELLLRVHNLLKDTKIYLDRNLCNTKITSFRSSIDTINRTDDGNFKVKSITVPSKYNDLASIYFGHEIIHSLKDTNPSEYQYMLKYADVIPMFYELIESDKYDDISKKAIINNRLALLNSIKKEMRDDDFYSDNYIKKIICSKKCQYLNSFYYSILLYKIYKSNPKYILDLVKLVLNGKITTYNLICSLGLNDRELDNDVKEELIKIKNH